MDDNHIETPPAPAPKKRGRPFGSRNPRKRVLTPRMVAPMEEKQETKQSAGELEGLTQVNCADACNVDRCVISGRNYCAHPRKGALQRIDQQNKDAIERLNKAKLHLKRMGE